MTTDFTPEVEQRLREFLDIPPGEQFERCVRWLAYRDGTRLISDLTSALAELKRLSQRVMELEEMVLDDHSTYEDCWCSDHCPTDTCSRRQTIAAQKSRIEELEDCLLNVIGGQQDPNIRAEDLATLACKHTLETHQTIAALNAKVDGLEKMQGAFADVHLADTATISSLEAQLEKSDALAEAIDDKWTVEGSWTGPEAIADILDAYQESRKQLTAESRKR